MMGPFNVVQSYEMLRTVYGVDPADALVALGTAVQKGKCEGETFTITRVYDDPDWPRFTLDSHVAGS